MVTPTSGAFLVALVMVVQGLLLLGKGQQASQRFAPPPRWHTRTARFLVVMGWSTILCGVVLLVLLGDLVLNAP